MESRIINIFLLVSGLFFLGCKKEDAKPQPEKEILPGYTLGIYFPAYPETWWDYRKPDSTLVRFKVRGYSSYAGRGLPYLENMGSHLDGSNFLFTDYNTRQKVKSSIYSLQKDSAMICRISFSKKGIYGNNPPIRRIAVSIDTTLTVSGVYFQNVIIMKEISIINPDHRYFDYFAKNVGMIRRDSVNVNDSTDLIPILVLENYHLGS